MADRVAEPKNLDILRMLSTSHRTEPSETTKEAIRYALAQPSSYKKGGRVRKSGWALVHKGERVIRRGARALGAGRRKKAKSKKRVAR